MFEGTNTREESARLLKEKKRELREKFLARYSKNLGAEGKKSFKIMKKKGPVFKPAKITVKDYHLCPDLDTLKTLMRKKEVTDFKTTNKQIIEDNEIFTDEENEKLENLKNASFLDWNKTSVNLFIGASSKHGLKEFAKIAKEVPKKSEEEVKKYATAFWKNILLLKNPDAPFNRVTRELIDRKFWS